MYNAIMTTTNRTLAHIDAYNASRPKADRINAKSDMRHAHIAARSIDATIVRTDFDPDTFAILRHVHNDMRETFARKGA